MITFPSLYEENMKALLGEEGFKEYATTFERDYYQGLRVNTAKISPEEYVKRRKAQSGEDLRQIPWCPTGYFLEGETADFSKHPDYFAGLYYLQEPSAMAPANILPIEEGDYVADLCAAPGGKSTFLSAKLGRKGILFSNDISPSRAKALLKNLELQGATQAVTISENTHKLAQRFPEFFNKILVDAPCSGEGMFHKEPSIMKNWEQYGNEYYAKLQREILYNAYQLLSPGGLMLYSTCTFCPMEDEKMIEIFLNEHPDMHLVPIEKVGGMEDGHPEWSESGREDLKYTARFWPQKLEGQGHFAALLKKDGTFTPKSVEDRDRRGGFSAEDLKLWEAWCEENLTNKWQKILPQGGVLQKLGTSLYYSPIPNGALAGLRILRCGILLGELKKDRFEPSQAFAMTLKKGDLKRELDLDTKDEKIIRYLKGETLGSDDPEKPMEDGWTLVLADGYPLGWGKAVQGKLKNKYLKGWLL